MNKGAWQFPANYRISVKALIRSPDNPEKFLLIRGIDSSWELPGGGLDHGELPSEGLSREVEEELGYTISKVEKQPLAFWTMSKKIDGKLAYFAFVLYEAVASGEYKPSKEANEIGYFDMDEASKLVLNDNTKPYFNSAF